uniref:RING-type domain-containing protein n=1 Tax=Acrobeloides nanus TaxID=290746 RepID=A0A914CSY1_9BILA
MYNMVDEIVDSPASPDPVQPQQESPASPTPTPQAQAPSPGHEVFHFYVMGDDDNLGNTMPESWDRLDMQQYSPTMPQYFPSSSNQNMQPTSSSAIDSSINAIFARETAAISERNSLENSFRKRKYPVDFSSNKSEKTERKNLKISNEEEMKNLKEKLQKTEQQNSKLRKENEDLKKEITCIICLTEKKDTIFFPCTHMHSCSHCAERQKECAICRQHISGKCRIFL